MSISIVYYISQISGQMPPLYTILFITFQRLHSIGKKSLNLRKLFGDCSLQKSVKTLGEKEKRE